MTTTAIAESGAYKTIKQVLVANQTKIQHALPSQISSDRMIRTALNCIQSTPALLQCTPVSVYEQIIQAATYGWEIGGVLAECYLVPFRDGKSGEMRAQLIPGYRGLINLARNSGQVSTLLRGVVRQGDKFRFVATAEPPIYHEPATDADRSKRPIEKVWVMAKMRDGGYQPLVTNYADIIAHRNRFVKGYDRPDSPWQVHEERMCEKTTLRAFLLGGHVPMSAESRQLIEREKATEAIEADVVSSSAVPVIDDADINLQIPEQLDPPKEEATPKPSSPETWKDQLMAAIPIATTAQECDDLFEAFKGNAETEEDFEWLGSVIDTQKKELAPKRGTRAKK